ncbi:hypothetical protein CPB83DRAFT_455782 [Crepidotus variabilis]|uniref:Uncharacterized protein n=1 Tax=Crepidotus variabilis TaxID=179855 RepID=A0A9P6JMT7_9AGAR|nr:hypothetical protein CPB83DRAFT_455782 [Crepidotus variabilis]
MKFTVTFTFVAVALCALPQAFATVAFNVSPLNKNCGAGTTITCSGLTSGHSCKGNFSPNQAKIVVTTAQGNCHVSLYPQANQGGGVAQRLNTDTSGTCVETNVASWASYGVYCD